MRRALAVGVLMGVTAWAAWGQVPTQTQAARPEFDVASLKPVVLDGADTYTANLGTYRNGLLTQTNTTLAECTRFAYAITSDELLSGPEWIKSKMVRFDILAKTAPGTPREQALIMLRTLLEDRFKLVLRREPRVLSYYALTAPNGAQQMQPAQDPPAEGRASLHSGSSIHDNRITMLMLASLIARFTRTPVLDQTALPGAFEVKLDWTRDNSLPTAAPDAGASALVDGPSIFEAVQKQLGLKLEKRKGPVDVLVVDHTEKTPLAN